MKYGLFFVEGEKSVLEFINARFKCKLIATIGNFVIDSVNEYVIDERISISIAEMKQISDMSTPTSVLAVFEIPKPSRFKISKDNWYLGLEDIQDPGNMGTLLRTADWFGISHVFLSPNCVDVYNPKVVQASMGSMARVKIHKCNLEELLNSESIVSYAATIENHDYRKVMLKPGLILIGNEGSGLSEHIVTKASYRVTIPGKNRAESLNASIAGAILMARTID